jgi:hypothetical protein
MKGISPRAGHRLAAERGKMWGTVPREAPMSKFKAVEMAGVREYAEDLGVELTRNESSGREVVKAYNEAGYNITEVDLLDLLGWLKTNRPELWDEAKPLPHLAKSVVTGEGTP